MVKKGDYVAFTTKSGKVIKGEYDGTSVIVGKKKYKPPKSQLRKGMRPKPKKFSGLKVAPPIPPRDKKKAPPLPPRDHSRKFLIRIKGEPTRREMTLDQLKDYVDKKGYVMTSHQEKELKADIIHAYEWHSDWKKWKINITPKTMTISRDVVEVGAHGSWKKMFKKKKEEPKTKDKPKKKSTDKEDFMDIMSVMGTHAKSKEKHTAKDIDERVKLDKKAQQGKLTQKAFLEYITTQDGYDEAIDEDFENRMEYYMYGSYAVSESAQQKFFERVSSLSYKDAKSFRKALFNKLIKGKKFKSIGEASKEYISKMDRHHADTLDYPQG
jgi:hypothetical protein